MTPIVTKELVPQWIPMFISWLNIFNHGLKLEHIMTKFNPLFIYNGSIFFQTSLKNIVRFISIISCIRKIPRNAKKDDLIDLNMSKIYIHSKLHKKNSKKCQERRSIMDLNMGGSDPKQRGFVYPKDRTYRDLPLFILLD